MKKGILLIGLMVIFSVFVKAQEFKAKALFVYNFTRLIEWPGNTGSEFVIGILGNSPVTSELEQLAVGKRAGEQKIVVKRFRSMEDISSCHILYISHGSSNQIGDVLNKLGKSNTLVVGEKKGLVNNGAAINFVLSNNRLSFELEVNNAEKYGLKVSKSLENMALANS